MELTHINEQGRARMVDVSEKDDTKRIAVGFGKICMKKETLMRIQNQEIKKGDVLGVAQVTAIMRQNGPLKPYRCAIRFF